MICRIADKPVPIIFYSQSKLPGPPKLVRTTPVRGFISSSNVLCFSPVFFTSSTDFPYHHALHPAGIFPGYAIKQNAK
jgi:hypothetical protein